METMIQVNELTKVFKTDEVETWALDKVNIEIGQGESSTGLSFMQRRTCPYTGDGRALLLSSGNLARVCGRHGAFGLRQVHVASHSRPVGQPVFRAISARRERRVLL